MLSIEAVSVLNSGGIKMKEILSLQWETHSLLCTLSTVMRVWTKTVAYAVLAQHTSPCLFISRYIGSTSKCQHGDFFAWELLVAAGVCFAHLYGKPKLLGNRHSREKLSINDWWELMFITPAHPAPSSGRTLKSVFYTVAHCFLRGIKL